MCSSSVGSPRPAGILPHSEVRPSGPTLSLVVHTEQEIRHDRDYSSRRRSGRVKEINRFTVGWTGYFAFADTVLPFEKLEKWLRRRLRQVRWKEWKRPQTRYRNLRALGIPDHDARSWAPSQKEYWHKTMGLNGFTDPYRRFREC